jgi:hypothetical protein
LIPAPMVLPPSLMPSITWDDAQQMVIVPPENTQLQKWYRFAKLFGFDLCSLQVDVFVLALLCDPPVRLSLDLRKLSFLAKFSLVLNVLSSHLLLPAQRFLGLLLFLLLVELSCGQFILDAFTLQLVLKPDEFVNLRRMAHVSAHTYLVVSPLPFVLGPVIHGFPILVALLGDQLHFVLLAVCVILLAL